MAISVDLNDRVEVGDAILDIKALSSSKFVVVYADMYARVGEVSGTTITLGPGYNIGNTSIIALASIAVLDDSHFVVLRTRHIQDVGDRMYMTRYSVSGTSISEESHYAFDYNHYAFDIVAMDNRYVLVAFADSNDSDKPKVWLFQVEEWGIYKKDSITLSNGTCKANKHNREFAIDGGMVGSLYYFCVTYVTDDDNLRFTAGRCYGLTLDIDTTDTVIAAADSVVDVAFVPGETYYLRFLFVYSNATDDKVYASTYRLYPVDYSVLYSPSTVEIEDAESAYVGVEVFEWEGNQYFLVVYQRASDDMAMVNMGMAWTPTITTADEAAYESSASTNPLYVAALDPHKFIAIASPYAVAGMTGLINIAVSDSAVGSSDIEIRNAFGLTEQGAGTSLIGIGKDFALQDSGVGTDLPGVTVTLPSIQDSGIGTDIAAGYHPLSIFDTCVGVDEFTLQIHFTLTEAGTGMEVVTVGAAILPISDAGVGADSIANVLAQVPIADSGVGQELLDILAQIGVTDTGSIQDWLSLVKAFISVADTGAGTEGDLTINNWIPKVAIDVQYPEEPDIEYNMD